MNIQKSNHPKSAWRHREAKARKLGSALLPVFEWIDTTRIREASGLLEVVQEWDSAQMKVNVAHDMLDRQQMNDDLRDEMLRDARSDAGYSNKAIEDDEYDRYEYEHSHIKSLEDEVKVIEGKIWSLCWSDMTLAKSTVDDLNRLKNRLEDYIYAIQTQLKKVGGEA